MDCVNSEKCECHIPQKQQQKTKEYNDMNMKRTSVRSNTKSFRIISRKCCDRFATESFIHVDAMEVAFLSALTSITFAVPFSLLPLGKPDNGK